MKKTHYERMVEDWETVRQSFEILKHELPAEGFTWEQFMSTETMLNHASLETLYGIKNVMTSSQLLFHLYSYYIGKGRTYKVCDDMAEMLLHTKLDVDVRMVKSPFSEIHIVLPENGIIDVYNEETGYHPASSIYVNFHEVSDTENMLRFLLTASPNEKSINEYDDPLFYFRVPLHEGKVSESLDDCLVNWRSDPLNAKFATENDEGMLPQAFHFVLNVLLYITSHEADVVKQNPDEAEALARRLGGLKNPTKKRKVEKRLSSLSRLPVYMVGKNIHLSSEERMAYQNSRGLGRHSIRYPVGGHWRMQWYGPKEESYQKQRWIKPHFRGPEFAELVKSTGVIK